MKTKKQVGEPLSLYWYGCKYKESDPDQISSYSAQDLVNEYYSDNVVKFDKPKDVRKFVIPYINSKRWYDVALPPMSNFKFKYRYGTNKHCRTPPIKRYRIW